MFLAFLIHLPLCVDIFFLINFEQNFDMFGLPKYPLFLVNVVFECPLISFISSHDFVSAKSFLFACMPESWSNGNIHNNQSRHTFEKNTQTKCELQRIFGSHTHTHTFAHFNFGHKHIVLKCAFCPKFISQLHTQVYSKRVGVWKFLHFLMRIKYQGPWKTIERSLCHRKKSTFGPFFTPKRAKFGIPCCTTEKQLHARTSHTCFGSLFARTLHTCERANLIL